MWRLVGWLSSGLLDGIPPSLLDGFPGLVRHARAGDALEPVRAWMASHYGDKYGQA